MVESEDSYTPIANEDLVSYLRIMEDSSIAKEKYYVLRDSTGIHFMGNYFFKAKTSYGAILKLHQYMQEHKIPHFTEPYLDQYTDRVDNIFIFDPVDSLIFFRDLCDDFSEDFLIWYDDLIIV